jgi:hypothetical protein
VYGSASGLDAGATAVLADKQMFQGSAGMAGASEAGDSFAFARQFVSIFT